MNEYITLKPKGNVIYSDGTTLDVEEAQKVKHLIRYSTDLRIQENFVIFSLENVRRGLFKSYKTYNSNILKEE